MRAIVQHGYGLPDEVLQLTEVADPVPKDDEVQVRVRAAGISIGTWHLMRGRPYLMRPMVGLFGPRREIPGADLAGEVETVGTDVKNLQPGDPVFGFCDGAFAEYACAKQKNLLPKRKKLSYEQAAALGDSAITALNAVRDQAKVKAGQEVLINGASGGVGTYAVQIAKAFGADVTGVCSTRNLKLVRKLGADRVIDYTRESFIDGERQYDVILDLVGNTALSDCRRALKPDGTYVLVGVKDMDRWTGMNRQVRMFASSPVVRQKMRVFISTRNRNDLDAVKQLVEAGKVKPTIDRSYELSETPAALAQQGEGQVTGKLVIDV